MPKEQLFLIDGHALCYRSFYAIKGLVAGNGQPTNAVYGFVRYVRSILQEYDPKYVAVCFDSPEKTHREKKFAQYKIQRQPMPDELRSQIPVIKEVIKAFNIPSYECAGYEADDIIATLTKGVAKKGVDVVIVSDDKDLYQLAGKNVKYLGSRNGAMLDYRGLQEKLGFKPEQIVDFIGLAGDSSDNIPGVTGIGKVNAQQLINDYGSLEKIIKKLEGEGQLKGKEQLIIDQKQTAMLSRELAVLDVSVPIKYELNDLKVRPPDGNRLYALFKSLEFRKLSEEYAPSEKHVPVDCKVLKNPAQIKSLVRNIQQQGKFTFYSELSGEEGLFQNAAIYITCDDKKVYRVALKDIQPLAEIFRQADILKITYNMKDQLKALSRHDVDLQGDVFDVMLAGYLLATSSYAVDLDSLAWNYLQRTIPEEQRPEISTQIIEQLYPYFAKELKAHSLNRLFSEIELPLARVLFTVEKNGVKLDLSLLKKLSGQCAKKIEELTATLYDMAGEEFNLNSPKQLSHILFDKLNLPVIKKTKTGYSTDEAVLTILSGNHAFPSLILEYRQLSKLKSTYIDALPKLVNPETGKIHTQFNQIGAETGRLSSSRPNLQNIPIRTELGRQIRKAFIPSQKNWSIMAADYSQIELRVLAHLSGDKNLIKAFKRGEDIHTYTASLIFDKKEKDVTAHMRNSAKRVNFGIIYGISAFGLSNDLKVTQAEAQDFIEKYFLRYPSVKNFMDAEIKKCERLGYVTTLLKRRRYLSEIHSKNGAVRQFAQRQAINTPVQGSAADMLKISMIGIQKDIEKKKLKSKMISTVHDELVFETPKAEQKDLIAIIRKNMEHTIALDVPIKVSIKVGKNWLDMGEIS